jgi:diguanylate cyclase (GGDEF)-like protein
MGRDFSAWLCPTALDRARLLDNSARLRHARLVSAVAIALTLIYFLPTYGWWTVALFAVAALNMGTVDWRVARSTRPQLHIAASVVLIQVLVAASVALSNGPASFALPWIVLPAAFAAARFRAAVVVADVALGIVLLLAATLGTNADGFVQHPAPLLVTSVLIISITAIAYVLSAAEVEQRGEAVLDHLTGLLNRTSLHRRFVELAEQAALTGEPISLILLDIDHFKAINDEHGHARGDAVLREVAYEVRTQLRSFELAYRLGGEEFLVLLPGSTLEVSAEIAERLRSTLVRARPARLAVTASFGVAVAVGAAPFDELFAHADTSLYRAKAGGRNRVEVTRPDADLPRAA